MPTNALSIDIKYFEQPYGELDYIAADTSSEIQPAHSPPHGMRSHGALSRRSVLLRHRQNAQVSLQGWT